MYCQSSLFISDTEYLTSFVFVNCYTASKAEGIWQYFIALIFFSFVALPNITISNRSPWSVGPVTELLEVEEGRIVNLRCSLGNADISGVMYQWYKIVDGKQTPGIHLNE